LFNLSIAVSISCCVDEAMFVQRAITRLKPIGKMSVNRTLPRSTGRRIGVDYAIALPERFNFALPGTA
jgi:hypothetical protein